MTKKRIIRAAIAACFLAISPSPLMAGPEATPVPHPITIGGSYYDMVSAESGLGYRVFVRIPSTAPPPGGFPVVYVLDGNWYFPIAATTANLQANTGELPPAVIVGIGYPTDGTISPLRMRDLTLPADLKSLPPRIQATKPDIGGGAAFLRFVNQQVKPFVAKLAPIDTRCQTLYGHSLGGLIVLHALFTAPESFQAFVAASPSIWWGDSVVLKDEAAFAARVSRGGTRPRLLMTVGRLEQTAPPPVPAGTAPAFPFKMVDNASGLAARLGKLPADRMQMVIRVIEEERHNSSVPASLNRGLHFGLECGGHN